MTCASASWRTSDGIVAAITTADRRRAVDVDTRFIIANPVIPLVIKTVVPSGSAPDHDRVIAAARGEKPAVGAERHTADDARVAAETPDHLPSGAVPDFHGTVAAARGDPPA